MPKQKPFLPRLLDAMRRHGEDSDPEMEVGDLQMLVRDLWNELTPAQKTALAGREDYRELIEFWGGKS